MSFTNLKKYGYSKKCLKQRRQPPPPPPIHPSVWQSRRYFRAEKVTWLQLLFATEYATEYVPFIVHLKRLFPTAKDQEDCFKRAEFLNNCHKSLSIYN